MSKNVKICKKCGIEYSKKLVRCPACMTIDEVRARHVYDIELRACYNPENGLRCKKCGTLYPNEMHKCPYCLTKAEDAGRPIIRRGGGEKLETPLTKYFGYNPHVIKSGLSAKNLIPQTISIKMIPCKCCNEKISNKAETCPNCGNPTGVHVCPKCTSTNTKVITGTSKAASIFLWGVFAASKVVSKFECKDCGHKF